MMQMIWGQVMGEKPVHWGPVFPMPHLDTTYQTGNNMADAPSVPLGQAKPEMCS